MVTIKRTEKPTIVRGMGTTATLRPQGIVGPKGETGDTGAPGGSDASFAGWIDDPASDTRASLSATYARVEQARPGNRWVALGDSITQGSVDNTNRALGEAWPVYAALMSQQRLHLVRDSGVGGNTSAQMLARFDADVAAYQPNIVTIIAGTNDIGTSVPFATFKANIEAMVAETREIGAVPVIGTIPPRDAGGYGPTIVLWNAWLRDYCERQGINVIDVYRTLTDPTNGHYLAAYFNDGIHPNAAGAAAIGEVASWVLGQMVPNNSPLLPVDSTDTNNLLGAAGLFLSEQGSGVGTGWTPQSAPSGVTKSVITDPAVPGGMQKIVMAAASGIWVQQIDIAAGPGWAVGDTLRLIGVASSDGGAGVGLQVQTTFVSGAAPNTARPLSGFTRAFTRGVFCQDVPIPTGTTTVRFFVQCGSAGASGTVHFGQCGVYNLTQMGLAA